MNALLSDRRSTAPLTERFISYIKQYAENAKPMMQMQNPPPSGSAGALKTALTRAVRYNDKKTTQSAPKPAGGQAQ